jgi:myosin heavy subunit
VRNALSVLGIGPEEDIWAVVAAVLHMGNIRFAPQGDGSTVVNTDCTLHFYAVMVKVLTRTLMVCVVSCRVL